MAQQQKILVIDDTELIRMIYRDRLNAEGYDVSLATDGVEGMAAAVEKQPDLILLDLVMPRQNGLTTLEQLKTDPRTHDIPVIILSNRDDEEEIKSGMRLGAEDFLKKVGASPVEVTEKIRCVLDAKCGLEASAAAGPAALKLYVRDREGDAEAMVEALGLTRRFWCPACEQELHLELVEDTDAQGGHWYKAHLVCPVCHKGY